MPSLKTLIATAGVWGPGFVSSTDPTVTTTTAMTNLATAYKVKADITAVTTSGATGNTIALPANADKGDWYVIGNNTANALSIVPATAAGTINAGAAGVAFAQAASKNAEFVCLGNDKWLALLSA